MTLKQIAARAGTSVSTVSRVLNHPEHQCHDQALKERIWDIAHELGYTPDMTARNLRMGVMTNQNPFPVDIFLTRFDSVHTDAFFDELLQILRKELLENNCVFGSLMTSVDISSLNQSMQISPKIPYWTSEKLTREKELHTSAFVTTKKDTGLIVLGKISEENLRTLRMRYDYIVGIDRNPTNYLYDEVFCNGATATEKAINHLIALGHHSIAYIGDCNYESRYIGYYQTLLTNKLPLNHNHIFPTDQTEEEGYLAMCRLLKQKDRPSAIFCANDTTALGVLRAIKGRKSRQYKPSVISIDDIEAAKHSTPSLTTISIPKEEMGHLALMLLLDRRMGGHTKNIRIELPCHLIQRESCDYFYS